MGVSDGWMAAVLHEVMQGPRLLPAVASPSWLPRTERISWAKPYVIKRQDLHSYSTGRKQSWGHR